jgi:L,D-transpeptidase ErfK/SrfK
MRAQGKRVLTRVEPGPNNPLGHYWIGLSLSGYGIHGTNAPSSIYGLGTHGCMRVHPADIGALYGFVAVGMPVTIIYAHTLFAVLGDGRVMAETNPDVYRHGSDPLQVMHDMAHAKGVEGAVDWSAADRVAKARTGQAFEIGHIAADAASADVSVSTATRLAAAARPGEGCDGRPR